jgi:hypothetical protein
MTTPDTNEGGDEEQSSELWEEIGDDVTAMFGDDVDVTVKDYSNHIDVRIVPNGAVDELEAEHEDLTVVPYNACQMTIRKDDTAAE